MTRPPPYSRTFKEFKPATSLYQSRRKDSSDTATCDMPVTTLLVGLFLCLRVSSSVAFVAPNSIESSITSRTPVTQRRWRLEARQASSELSSSSLTALFSSPSSSTDDVPWNVQINEFFQKPVPDVIRKRLEISTSLPTNTNDDAEDDAAQVWSQLIAAPGSPGVPRPLWLVILGSVPTGLLWYGYYKFAVEEELLYREQQQQQKAGTVPSTVRGFGGYGTLGIFVYGCLLGPLAALLHLPGGILWSNVGIFFIYFTQVQLYIRVNELLEEEYKQNQVKLGGEDRSSEPWTPPLTIWWCLPIFFPLDLMVGLRQVHFLSEYYYRQGQSDRNKNIPTDAVVEFFPFIGTPTLTWPEFFLTPSLWFLFFKNVTSVDATQLPTPVQEFLLWGDKDILVKTAKKEQRQE